MLHKTDNYFRRTARVWRDCNGGILKTEDYRLERWWLFGCIPLYSRETVI